MTAMKSNVSTRLPTYRANTRSVRLKALARQMTSIFQLWLSIRKLPNSKLIRGMTPVIANFWLKMLMSRSSKLTSINKIIIKSKGKSAAGGKKVLKSQNLRNTRILKVSILSMVNHSDQALCWQQPLRSHDNRLAMSETRVCVRFAAARA